MVADHHIWAVREVLGPSAGHSGLLLEVVVARQYAGNWPGSLTGRPRQASFHGKASLNRKLCCVQPRRTVAIVVGYRFYNHKHCYDVCLSSKAVVKKGPFSLADYCTAIGDSSDIPQQVLTQC